MNEEEDRRGAILLSLEIISKLINGFLNKIVSKLCGLSKSSSKNWEHLNIVPDYINTKCHLKVIQRLFENHRRDVLERISK